MFTVFGVIAAVTAPLFMTLHTKSHNTVGAVETANLEKSSRPEANVNTIVATIGNSIMEAFKLLVTKEMLLCISLFMYSGFVRSFYQGVYSTAIGNSKSMPEHMGSVGLVGVFTGVGAVIGGSLFVFGSKFTNKVPRPVVLLWYDPIIVTFIN